MSTASRLGGSLLAAILVLAPPIAELLGLGHSLLFLLFAATGLMGVAVVAIAAEPSWKGVSSRVRPRMGALPWEF